MNPQEWDHWLRSFLKRHPLKDPPQELQRDYHRQVMDRILAPPVWVFSPKPVFGWAGALAAVAAVLVLMPTPARVTRQIDREEALEIWDDLESLEEIPAGDEPDAEEDLEKELRQLDESELAIT